MDAKQRRRARKLAKARGEIAEARGALQMEAVAIEADRIGIMGPLEEARKRIAELEADNRQFHTASTLMAAANVRGHAANEDLQREIEALKAAVRKDSDLREVLEKEIAELKKEKTVSAVTDLRNRLRKKTEENEILQKKVGSYEKAFQLLGDAQKAKTEAASG